MIPIAVISTQDSFRRTLRHTASSELVRITLSLRYASELRSGNGIEAIVLHDPVQDDIESVIDAAPEAVLIAAVTAYSPPSSDESVTVVPADDPTVILAAVRARVAGLDVSWPDFEIPASAGGGRSEELTPRELNVLSCAADGSTNQIIASDLGISENTVKYHLSSIYAKLGVSRRSEMVFEAIRRGLVSL